MEELNLEFHYKCKFANEEDLIEGVPFLKLKNDNIKSSVRKKE
jgi:hypothetical protein